MADLRDDEPVTLRGRAQKWFDAIIGSILVALVLGFFATLWTKNSQLEEVTRSTQALIGELAGVQARSDARISELESALKAQGEVIRGLRDYLARATRPGDRPPPPEITTPPQVPRPTPEDVLQRAREAEKQIRESIQLKK